MATTTNGTQTSTTGEGSSAVQRRVTPPGEAGLRWCLAPTWGWPPLSMFGVAPDCLLDPLGPNYLGYERFVMEIPYRWARRLMPLLWRRPPAA